jgi:hypothetical protein
VRAETLEQADLKRQAKARVPSDRAPAAVVVWRGRKVAAGLEAAEAERCAAKAAVAALRKSEETGVKELVVARLNSEKAGAVATGLLWS